MKEILKNIWVFLLDEIEKHKIKTAGARHYRIYDDINFFYGEYIRPAIRCIPKLLELGLLNKEDLYIDLTGGDDTMGVSDDMLIKLRIKQNCIKMPDKDKISLSDKMVDVLIIYLHK